MTDSLSSRFAAVLFDLDGTVVDTYDLIVESFRHGVTTVLGPDEPVPVEEFTATMGTPLNEQVKLLFGDRGEEVCREIPRVYREYNKIVHDKWVHEFEGVGSLLHTLEDAGVQMGIVTSKMHSAAAQSLTTFDYLPLFDCLVGADDCTHTKPNAEPVLNGARLLGVDPADCLYVGDSIFDMQSGSAAGTQTAAVLWGAGAESALRAEQPTYVCATPQQLLSVILQKQGTDA